MTTTSTLATPFPGNRRFNSYVEYFREQFGERVQKVSVDGNFTCPNRDGTRGDGGCTYCNNASFNPSYCQRAKSIREQVDEGIVFHKRRYRRAKKFLAYFQAYSNTYAEVKVLEERYRAALEVPGVIGLVIGTRPDCMSEETLAYLKDLAQEVYLHIEYGLESTYNTTLDRINRGHSWEESVFTIARTHAAGLRMGAHMMFGLPGETPELMMAQADTLSALPLQTIKFHQLQLIKGTRMAAEFEQHPQDFHRFSVDEYIEFIIDFSERLNPTFVIERFCGEVPPRFLAHPSWGLVRNDQVLRRIEERFEERNTWQGRLFKAL